MIPKSLADKLREGKVIPLCWGAGVHGGGNERQPGTMAQSPPWGYTVSLDNYPLIGKKTGVNRENAISHRGLRVARAYKEM